MKTQNKKNKFLMLCIVIYKNKDFLYVTHFKYIEAFCKNLAIPFDINRWYGFNDYPILVNLTTSPFYSDLKTELKNFNNDPIRLFKNFIKNLKKYESHNQYKNTSYDTNLITFLISKNNTSMIYVRIPNEKTKYFLAKMLKKGYIEKEEALLNLKRINNHKSNEIKIDLSGYTKFFTEIKNENYAQIQVNNIISNIRDIVKELNNDKQ